MVNRSWQIMTINAKSLFKYFPKKVDQERFCFDTRKRTMYTLVVKAEGDFEECPLRHQFLKVLEEDLGKQYNKEDDLLLYDQFLIMDFEDIFMPLDKKATEVARKWKEGLQSNVKDIMEHGFDVRFDNHTIHMMPFDKSGNMSRNGRISFVNEKYINQLNERLNLGMNFKEIKVQLSKYYAYRGLYLSTSRRVEHEKFKLTPETIIIVKDKKESSSGTFERDVMVETAKPGVGLGEWNFQEPKKNEILHVETPFDGEGFISPEYAKYVNEALSIQGASSLQIRLPFAKGMLHQVDFLEFIREFTVAGIGEKQYFYEDIFGIERDLRKAHLILTESMFKGKKWLKEHWDKNKDKIKDPMQYYCDMIAIFDHALYVSGTNLPYGHSKYTHLSYQTINTLALNDEQFKRIIDGHGKFIKNPIEFFTGWDEIEKDSVIKEDGDISYSIPNWKKAVIENPDFAGDKYIREQLDNTRKGLLSKMALGKVLVEGQTRYLCRDLYPLLSSLLREDKDDDGGYIRKLYTRFYLPRGKKSKLKLTFEDYYAFFRNPHLSRNEQFIMRAFVLPKSEDSYAKDGRKDYEHYVKYVKMYDKYFGHLTGIVMVPSGSTLPLCLGGADFDGDLVSVILNQDVVAAVQKGVYEWMDSKSLYWYKRKMSAIEIPSTTADPVVVPDYVEYDHIYHTFSNHIGRISNAAISIGQIEYDRNASGIKEFDAMAPTCAKCTLLTGLEIDAAKNGVHPKLNLILDTGIKKSAYLSFLRGFRELKSERYFHLDKLSVTEDKKKVNGEEKDIIQLSAPSCETTVEWCPEEEQFGTYINLLPKYFLHYYEIYKNQKLSVPAIKIKKSKEKTSKSDNETVKKFIASCEGILALYKYYNDTLLKVITREKNTGYYAVENTENLLMRTYDEDNVDEQLFVVLPRLKERIEAITKRDESLIDEIRERINSLQWQFQPYSKRAVVLEKIIGNGFSESDLTDQERALIYHFNQQGYKLLWRLLDMIEGPKMATYHELYDKCVEENSVVFPEEFELLVTSLNEAMRRYYENNAINISSTLYALCLQNIKNMVYIYSASIENKAKLVCAFYQLTKSSVGRAKFFWDTFEWDEIKSAMEVEVKEKC